MKSAVISFYEEIRAHRLLTVRAVMTGWLVWCLYYLLKSWVVSHAFFQRLAFVMPLAFGHGLTQGLVWWVPRLCAWAASGWVVARLHRKYAPTMVLAFAASVFLWKLQTLYWVAHLLVFAVGEPRGRLEFVAELMGIILPPAFALLGGTFTSNAGAQPQKLAAVNP